MDYAQQLADFAHILEQKRLVTALEGNASVIDRQTGLTYVTPSGRMKLLLEKEDICVMNAAGEQIGGALWRYFEKQGDAKSALEAMRASAARGRLSGAAGCDGRGPQPLPVSDGLRAAVSEL